MTTQAGARATREAKLEALQQQLTDSVAALVTDEDWKRALTFAAQFRSRSFNNTMLIYVQHFSAFKEGRVPEPTPTYVAGFHQWLSLGRHVEKGQRGYGILAPVTARFASTPDPLRARLPVRDRSGETVSRSSSASSPRTSGTRYPEISDPVDAASSTVSHDYVTEPRRLAVVVRI